MIDPRFITEDRKLRVGFVANDGIVRCGACVTAILIANPHADLDTLGIEPYDPQPGDDWCSDCNQDIHPRRAPA